MNPVILLHGLGDKARIFRHLVAKLDADGRESHAFDFVPNGGQAPLEHLAKQAANHIETHIAPHQPIDIVGFSMGGIIARYYLQRLGGLHRTQRLITVGSPHGGTLTAHLLPRHGARQMRPRSTFLKDLNHDVHRLGHLKVASIWTPYDLMILPTASARLPGSSTHRVDVAAHAWMLRDHRVLALVHELLNN